MKQAGCYHITYGVESAKPETLKRIKKKIDLKRAGDAVKWTKQLGIECKVNFIFGFPWESKKDMKDTVRYAMDLAPDLVSFNIYKPLPGSVLYWELEQAGKITHTRWEDYFVTSEALLFEADFTEKDLRKLIRWAFLVFHFRPRFIWQRLMRFMKYPKREAVTIGRGLGILVKELLLMARS